MKKTLLLSAVAALLLSAVSAIVYVNNEADAMDDLFNANVEALSIAEHGAQTCVRTITMSDHQFVRYCGNCQIVPGKPTWFSGRDTCTL